MSDSCVKGAITCRVLYAFHGLLLNLMELNSLGEMSSSPNHDASSHPFLAHLLIFPLIQCSEHGGNGGRFSKTGIPEFPELMAEGCSVCLCQQYPEARIPTTDSSGENDFQGASDLGSGALNGENSSAWCYCPTGWRQSPIALRAGGACVCFL